jgi:hypothetical protein
MIGISTPLNNIVLAFNVDATVFGRWIDNHIIKNDSIFYDLPKNMGWELGSKHIITASYQNYNKDILTEFVRNITHTSNNEIEPPIKNMLGFLCKENKIVTTVDFIFGYSK